MLKNRFQVSRKFVLLVLGVGAGTVAACGDTKTSFDPSGGAANSAGNGGSAGWTYLPPGTDVGGKSASGGATGLGGKSGSAGASVNAGSGGKSTLPPVTFKCGGEKPNQPLITSFTDFKQDRWISPGNLDGGVYIYPDPFKVEEGDALGFDNTIKDYSGIGVWFAGCIDASKFKGVRFSMSGDAGSTGSLQFYAIGNRNRDVDETNSVGACVPDDVNDPWLSCRPPVVRLTVTDVPTTQTVLWSQFKGGLPTDKTDGSDILALQWSFDWQSGEPSYDAKLTIDDLEFVTDGTTGGSGAGGSGGAAGTSAGGVAGSNGGSGSGGVAGSDTVAGSAGTTG